MSKEWLTLIIIVLILVIVLDGLRRVRNARYGKIRMASGMKKRSKKVPNYEEEPVEEPSYTSELPNGGARVVAQREPLGSVPSIEKKASAKSFLEKQQRKFLGENRRSSRAPEQTSLNLGESVPLLMEAFTQPRNETPEQERIEPTFASELAAPDNQAQPQEASLQDRPYRDGYEADDNHEPDDAYVDAREDEEAYEGEDGQETAGIYEEQLAQNRYHGRDSEDHNRDHDLQALDINSADSEAYSEENDPLFSKARAQAYDEQPNALVATRDAPLDDEYEGEDFEDERHQQDYRSVEDDEDDGFEEDGVEGDEYDDDEEYDEDEDGYEDDYEDEYDDLLDDEQSDEHDDFGQAAQAPAKTQLQAEPEEVLIINIMSRAGEVFNGGELLDALLRCGLRYGDMDIFHRYANVKGEGALLFSMANMVKPGTFDLDAMEEFTTPGVSLFMTLPLNADSMQSFELMVDTAKYIAETLGGELKDEQRSVMTRQTIEHARQRILDFERRRLFRRPR